CATTRGGTRRRSPTAARSPPAFGRSRGSRRPRPRAARRRRSGRQRNRCVPREFAPAEAGCPRGLRGTAASSVRPPQSRLPSLRASEPPSALFTGRYRVARVDRRPRRLYGAPGTKGVVPAVAIQGRLERITRRGAQSIRVRSVLAFGVVTAAYIGGAKLGLELSVAHGVITPVWPPTGIALAALLLLGPRYWPAITLGAFISNVTSGASPEVAVPLAIGNTLEALAAVYLLRRVDFRPSLDRARDV